MSVPIADVLVGTRADLGFSATSVFAPTCGRVRGLASFCHLMIDGGEGGGVVPKFSFLPGKNFALSRVVSLSVCTGHMEKIYSPVTCVEKPMFY